MQKASGAKRFRGPAKVALFCCLFAALFLACQSVLYARFEQDSCLGRRYELYGEEPAGSIDMLLLGSSAIFWGVAPTVLWETAGFTSVNLSSVSQTAVIAYYKLRTLLRLNAAPKFALFDMNDLSRDSSDRNPLCESAYYYFLETLPTLPERAEALRAIATAWGGRDGLKYALPLLRFHSRWSALGPDDFAAGIDHDALYQDFRKGVLPQTETFDVTILENAFQGYVDEHVEADELVYDPVSLAYWEKTIQLCKDNGIQPVVLIVRRFSNPRTLDEADALAHFCEARGIPYINHYDPTLYDEIGLDAVHDYMDRDHLNARGMFKFSEALAQQLADLIELPDHSTDEAYDDWDEWSDAFRAAYYPVQD